jgi:hypothetical protein
LPVYRDIGGETAAEEYFRLAEREDQGPWHFTYVKGLGYKNFEGKEKSLRAKLISSRSLATNRSA